MGERTQFAAKCHALSEALAAEPYSPESVLKLLGEILVFNTPDFGGEVLPKPAVTALRYDSGSEEIRQQRLLAALSQCQTAGSIKPDSLAYFIYVVLSDQLESPVLLPSLWVRLLPYVETLLCAPGKRNIYTEKLLPNLLHDLISTRIIVPELPTPLWKLVITFYGAVTSDGTKVIPIDQIWEKLVQKLQAYSPLDETPDALLLSKEWLDIGTATIRAILPEESARVKYEVDGVMYHTIPTAAGIACLIARVYCEKQPLLLKQYNTQQNVQCFLHNFSRLRYDPPANHDQVLELVIMFCRRAAPMYQLAEDMLPSLSMLLRVRTSSDLVRRFLETITMTPALSTMLLNESLDYVNTIALPLYFNMARWPCFLKCVSGPLGADQVERLLRRLREDITICLTDFESHKQETRLRVYNSLHAVTILLLRQELTEDHHTELIKVSGFLLLLLFQGYSKILVTEQLLEPIAPMVDTLCAALIPALEMAPITQEHITALLGFALAASTEVNDILHGTQEIPKKDISDFFLLFARTVSTITGTCGIPHVSLKLFDKWIIKNPWQRLSRVPLTEGFKKYMAGFTVPLSNTTPQVILLEAILRDGPFIPLPIFDYCPDHATFAKQCRDRVDWIAGSGINRWILAQNPHDIFWAKDVVPSVAFTKAICDFIEAVIAKQGLQRDVALKSFLIKNVELCGHLWVNPDQNGNVVLSPLLWGLQEGLRICDTDTKYAATILELLSSRCGNMVQGERAGEALVPTLAILSMFERLPREGFSKVMSEAPSDIYDAFRDALRFPAMESFWLWTLNKWHVMLKVVPEVIGVGLLQNNSVIELTSLLSTTVAVPFLAPVTENKIMDFVGSYYTALYQNTGAYRISKQSTVDDHRAMVRVLHRRAEYFLSIGTTPTFVYTRMLSDALRAVMCTRDSFACPTVVDTVMYLNRWYLDNAVEEILRSPTASSIYYWDVFLHLAHQESAKAVSSAARAKVLTVLSTMDAHKLLTHWNELPLHGETHLVKKYHFILSTFSYWRTVSEEMVTRGEEGGGTEKGDLTEADIKAALAFRANFTRFLQICMGYYESLLKPGAALFRFVDGSHEFIATLLLALIPRDFAKGAPLSLYNAVAFVPLAVHFTLVKYPFDEHEIAARAFSAALLILDAYRANIRGIPRVWIFEASCYDAPAITAYLDVYYNMLFPEGEGHVIGDIAHQPLIRIMFEERVRMEGAFRAADDALYAAHATQIEALRRTETGWNELVDIIVFLKTLLKPPVIDPTRFGDPVYRSQMVNAARAAHSSPLTPLHNAVLTALQACSAFLPLKNYQTARAKCGVCWFEDCDAAAIYMCLHCQNIFCQSCLMRAMVGAQQAAAHAFMAGAPHCPACNTTLGRYSNQLRVEQEFFWFYLKFTPQRKLSERLGGYPVVPHRVPFDPSGLADTPSPRRFVEQLSAIIEDEKKREGVSGERMAGLNGCAVRVATLLEQLPAEALDGAGKKRHREEVSARKRGVVEKDVFNSQRLLLALPLESVCGYSECRKKFEKGTGGGVCGHCKSTAYCSRECQCLDARVHSAGCQQFYYK